MTRKDHLSNAVGFRARLSEKGLSAEVRSRAISAFDRLLGSLIDIPTAKLEAWAARNRTLGTARQEIESDQTEQYGAAISQHSSEQATRSANNKRHVAERAVEHIAQESAADSHTGASVVDEDWLNYFEGYAEKASTEKMRDLWGRVLAGEIRNPKCFSLTTLRFLAELDQTIASTFETAVEQRTSDGGILRPDPNDMKGKKLLDLVFLEEIGLLQGVHGRLKITQNPDDEGVIYWREGSYLLIAEAKTAVELPLIKITRVGCEIARILPPTDAVGVLEAIGERIDAQVDAMRIVTIVGDTPDGFHQIQPFKTLKTAGA